MRIALVPTFIVLAASLGHAQDDSSRLESLVTRLAPAIVTVKAVLKTEMKFTGASQAQESRVNLSGVAVSEDGLIMVSNTAFSPTRAMEVMGMPSEMRDEMSMKVTPVSLKVLYADDETEYDAFLAATDTKLDLAFIKTEKLGDRKTAFVDFGAATSALIGQKVIQVGRLGRGYDYAPYFQTAQVNGEIKKPRAAWMLEGAISTFGLPVFALSGDVVGVLTTVPAGTGEEGAAEDFSMGMMMRLMSGAGAAPGGSFVLPAQVVKGIVEMAKERAVQVAAERAKKPAPKAQQKPATPPAKPAVKPKTGK